MQFIVRRFAIGAVLFVEAVAPQTHTQDEPTLGEVIQCHALSGQLPRSASRQGSDDGTEFDTAGGHRYRCQCYPRIGHWDGLKRAASNMVPHEEAVPSCIFSLMG